MRRSRSSGEVQREIAFGNSFTADLFRLMCHADSTNFIILKQAYPQEAAEWENWKQGWG
jgi:hypothetical protein